MAKAAAQKFKARRAEPGTTFGYTNVDGAQKTFHADDEGLVTAKNDAEEQVLVGFDLPVARIETRSSSRSIRTSARSRTTTRTVTPTAPATETPAETSAEGGND